MILLKSIKLNNFISHANTEITFKESERLLIDGKSGSGKSSIIDALTWVFYNVGRVQNRALIKRGTTSAFVEVVLINTENGILYRIKRSITSKGEHTIELSHKEIHENDFKPVAVSGTKNIQTYIEKEILQCSYTLFINSVCYPQENFESFVRQTPSKRKDLIFELIHAEDYDDYYEKTRLSISIVNEKMSNLEGKRLRLQEELKELELRVIDIDSTIVEIEAISGEIKNVEILIDEARIKEIEVLRLQDRLTACDNEIKNLNNQLSRLYETRDGLNKKIQEFRQLDEGIIKTKTEKLKILKDEMSTMEQELNKLYTWKDEFNALQSYKPQSINFSARLKQLNTRLESLSNRKIGDESCPHCDYTHPCLLMVSEIEDQIKLVIEEIKEVKESEDRYNLDVITFQNKEECLLQIKPKIQQEKILELRSQIAVLEPFTQQLAKLELKEEQIRQYSEAIVNIETSTTKLLSEIKLKENEVVILNNEIKIKSKESNKAQLLNRLENLTHNLWEAKERLILAKNAQERVSIITKDIEQSSENTLDLQADLENLLLLKEAFGTNGIKSIIIDYVLPQLEQRINGVLGPLSDFRIKLETQKSSVSGDNTIEGLFITVINDQGEEFEYNSYSGGQKIKILFAITEGLAQIQKIGFRLLDEAVIGLDEESTDAFVKAILAFQSRFQQLVCISHITAVKEIFENQINIISQRGNSIIDAST